MYDLTWEKPKALVPRRLRLEVIERLAPDGSVWRALDDQSVREAAKRTLNQRHFDVQLMGGTVLHQGKIAEMKTGEGKTLVSTLAAYLNAIKGEGVHIVTVNDYLAKRDAQWMGAIYRTLGLSVGVLQHDASSIYIGQNEDLGFATRKNKIYLIKI